MKNQDLQAIALARQGLSPSKIGELLGQSKEHTAFKVTFDNLFKYQLEKATSKNEEDLDYNAEEPEFNFNEEVDKLLPLAFQTARELLEYGENEAVKKDIFKWLGDQKSEKNTKGISFNINDINLRLETAQKRVEENFVDVDSY